jgi:hypothetical protein
MTEIEDNFLLHLILQNYLYDECVCYYITINDIEWSALLIEENLSYNNLNVEYISCKFACLHPFDIQ